MAQKVKATVKKTVAAKEVKPVETKVETKVEAKVETKAAEAPKAVAAPKAAVAPKSEPAKKEAAPKKEVAPKKAAAPKKTAVKSNVVIEVADRKYSSADIEKIAKDVWVYDLGKKAAELKSMELYVKAEEANVYYVFNVDIQGVFGILF